MKQKPSLNKINELLQGISVALSESNIPYLVYGSYAYQHYTNDNIQINDIDIIVNQSDFKNIQDAFSENGLPYKLYITEYAIHANHNQEIGNDNKPFDVSFDSYDHYFANYDIGIVNFTEKVLASGVVTRLIQKEDLIKLYSVGANDVGNPKSDKYKLRLSKLVEPNTK